MVIYTKDFFSEFAKYFDAQPHPIDLIKGTLETARAYIHGSQEKRENKSEFGTFTGRHILKAGVAARDLEYSLLQLSKNDLAAHVLNWNTQKRIGGRSEKADKILAYIQQEFGPANPLDIYQVLAASLTEAADFVIRLPDDNETEKDYIARADAFSERVKSDKWAKMRKLPSHHALAKAAEAFKPLWEQHSKLLYYRGRHDETKGGFYSPPASALQFLIRKIAPEVKLTLVGTAIGTTRPQS